MKVNNIVKSVFLPSALHLLFSIQGLFKNKQKKIKKKQTSKTKP